MSKYINPDAQPVLHTCKTDSSHKPWQPKSWQRTPSRTAKELRNIRRAEAEERDTYWRSLTPEAQLHALEERGHGHCKQAVRLREQIFNLQA